MQLYDNTTALECALQYALRGWPVLPVQVWWEARDGKYKKHPLLDDWPHKASCNPDVVREMFSRTDIELSIGGITGPLSFYVEDIDPRNGGSLDSSDLTLMSKTISGGNHRFLKSSEIIKSGILRKGVDFKGAGGFVVLPGSPGYSWATDPKTPLAPVPTWMALRATHSAQDGAGARFLEVDNIEGYAASVLASVVQEVEEAPEGTRNDTLNAGSYRVGRFVGGGYLDVHEARDALEDAASVAGLGNSETQATLDSALTAGKAVPVVLVLPAENHDEFDQVEDVDADQAKDVRAEDIQDKRERKVAAEVERLHIREEAHRRFNAEKFASAPVPDSEPLSDLLDVEWDDDEYLIGELWPKDGNVLLYAQAKAGKTTMSGNLIRSLVDGDPFLGRFDVAPLHGNVALLNFEMSKRKNTDWLRSQGIVNHKKVFTWNLRGQSGLFDIRDEGRREEWAGKFKKHDIQVVIWDCITPVLTALGLDENSQLRNLLIPFGELIVKAGACEGLAVHHAGWDGGHLRGDSAAEGWPDAIWGLTTKGKTEQALEEVDGKQIMKTQTAKRFFEAKGRDVQLDRQLLRFDSPTRHLTIDGHESGLVGPTPRWVSMWWDSFGSTPVAPADVIGKKIVSKSTFYRHAESLVEQGILIKDSGGVAATDVTYRVATDPRS